MLGISISSFAYPLVVLDQTGSPANAGLVGSILAGTAFFLRLPAGVLVDRWNRRAILILCDLGRALNAGAFAVALALGHFLYAHVLVVAFVEAALGVLFGLPRRPPCVASSRRSRCARPSRRTRAARLSPARRPAARRRSARCRRACRSPPTRSRTSSRSSASLRARTARRRRAAEREPSARRRLHRPALDLGAALPAHAAALVRRRRRRVQLARSRRARARARPWRVGGSARRRFAITAAGGVIGAAHQRRTCCGLRVRDARVFFAWISTAPRSSCSPPTRPT